MKSFVAALRRRGEIVVGLLQHNHPLVRLRLLVVAKRQRGCEFRQVLIPPSFSKVLVPAIAGFAPHRHIEQDLSVLRPLVRILLKAGQNQLIELTWNRQLSSL